MYLEDGDVLVMSGLFQSQYVHQIAIDTEGKANAPSDSLLEPKKISKFLFLSHIDHMEVDCKSYATM